MKISLQSLFWLVTWIAVVIGAASILVTESEPGKANLPKLIVTSTISA